VPRSSFYRRQFIPKAFLSIGNVPIHSYKLQEETVQVVADETQETSAAVIVVVMINTVHSVLKRP
jgi:ABC-type phosphate transport system permease subunit